MSTELAFTAVWMFLVFAFIQKHWLIKNKHLIKQLNQKLVAQYKINVEGRPYVYSKMFNRLMLFIVFVCSFIKLVSGIDFWSNPLAVVVFVVSCMIILNIMIMSSLYQIYVPLACKHRLLKEQP